MKQKFIEAYMDVAYRFAQLSHAIRRKVGAVVVKDDRIISIGYNGTPTGWDNACETKEWCDAGGWLSLEEIEEKWPYKGEYCDSAGKMTTRRYRLTTKPEVLHAESNALMKLAKSNESGDGATMFVTTMPCIHCAKGIFQAGIQQVFYSEEYHNDEGVVFLRTSGVEVNQIKRAL